MARKYDPAQEEQDEPTKPAEGPAEAPVVAAPTDAAKNATPTPPVGLVVELVAAFESTPIESPPRLLRRIADTGRSLSVRQAMALHRLTMYATQTDRRFRSANSITGLVPCHKRAHTLYWLLDLVADLMDEIDGREPAGADQ